MQALAPRVNSWAPTWVPVGLAMEGGKSRYRTRIEVDHCTLRTFNASHIAFTLLSERLRPGSGTSRASPPTMGAGAALTCTQPAGRAALVVADMPLIYHPANAASGGTTKAQMRRRPMQVSRRVLLTTMAATGAAAIAPGVFAPAVSQSKPCRIGILAPRSGIAASAGESGLRATEWAVEKFNAGGGIAGRKIELVVEEETNPKDTIERFQKLVQQEKVDCVQGIVSTGVGLALGPVAEEARALTIYWDGTTQDGVDETLPNPKYLFRSTDNECEAVMSSLLTIKH